jgi:hypothetical protein
MRSALTSRVQIPGKPEPEIVMRLPLPSVRIPLDSHGRWLAAEFLLYNPKPTGGRGSSLRFPSPWRDLCRLPT